MKKRVDGVETRKRVVETACGVFAEKGFRDATIAEICRRAKTNTASINYHFRDKETLYIEVWKYAAERATILYPFDGGVSPNAAAADRLRGHVQALLQRMTDTGRLGHFHRLHMMEMANPTGIIDEVIRRIRQPHRAQLFQVLRELLGDAVTDRDIQNCFTSVLGQCQGVRMRLRWNCSSSTRKLTAKEVLDYADHITAFSLAGVRSVRKRAEAATK